jgi:hypothetical protein
MATDFRAYPLKTEYPKEPYLAKDWITKLWIRLEQQEQRISFLEQALKEKNNV